MKFAKLIIFGIVTSILISTFGGAASAAKFTGPTNSQQDEVTQLAGDLELLFSEVAYLEGDKYKLDIKSASENFGEESVASLEAFVKLLNGEQITEADLFGVPAPNSNKLTQNLVGTNSWASCVGNEILEYTGIGFLSGAMWELIEKKNWDLLAKELVKVVGKNAVKGGVVGLAASLAWFSVKCL